MKRSIDQQLNRVTAAGASGVFDVVIVLGAGLVGALTAVLAAACAKRVIVVDRDRVSETTTVVPPYELSDVGKAKAAVLAASLKRRFRHLGGGRCAGLFMDARGLGGGFWRAACSVGNVLVVAALDDRSTTSQVCARTRAAGLPTVVAQVGARSAEVVALQADPGSACYACLGLPDAEARPCLGGEVSEPTISTPDLGALCAAVAVAQGRQLLGGGTHSAMDTRLSFAGDLGLHSMVAEVPRAAHCPRHTPAGVTCVVRSTLSTKHNFAQLVRELGDDKAVWFPKALPPVTRDLAEARVPLWRLGVEAWPILHCEVQGRSVEVELAGDRQRLGLAQVLD